MLVNREEILELLGAARDELPEEIKQARWVVKDREELLSKARKDGEAIVEAARSDPTGPGWGPWPPVSWGDR